MIGKMSCDDLDASEHPWFNNYLIACIQSGGVVARTAAVLPQTPAYLGITEPCLLRQVSPIRLVSVVGHEP